MRAMPVVAVQPDGQFGGALFRGVVRPGVGPFAQAGLDEALRLAVGSGHVGPGAQMLDFEPVSVMTRSTLTPRFRKKRKALKRKRRQDRRFSSGRISE